MKFLRQKITKEMSKNYRLIELAKDDELDFYTAMDLYEEISKTNDKIRFLKGLNKALKEKENENIKK